MTINNLLEAKHQVKHIDTYYEYKANMEEALYEHQVWLHEKKQDQASLEGFYHVSEMPLMRY